MIVAFGRTHHDHRWLWPAAAGTIAWVIPVLFWFGDQSIAEVAVRWPSAATVDFVSLISGLGWPVPYLAGSAVILTFCGLVYVDTGFCFAEVRVPQRALFVLLTAGIVWGCVAALEIGFGRPHPDLYVYAHDYVFRPFSVAVGFDSFPSERVALVAGIATALSAMIPAYRPTFLLLATGIGLSRVAVGLDYPSDVLAGMVLGFLVTTCLKDLFKHIGIALERNAGV